MGSRRWCFTINNPTQAPSKLWNSSKMKYMIIGKEVGESGTPHFQGFTVLWKTQRLSGMKKLLPRAHLEKTRGSSQEAYSYCMKDSDWVEFGDRPVHKGEASKEMWKGILEAAKDGRFDDIPPKIYARLCKNFEFIHEKYQKKPDDIDGAFTNVWIWGKSGTGKSMYVKEHYPDAYRKPLNEWWTSYRNQDVVHMDEVSPRNLRKFADDFKIWADRYAFIANIKGGGREIRPKTMVVTSQYSIAECCSFDTELEDAVRRRFPTVIKLE